MAWAAWAAGAPGMAGVREDLGERVGGLGRAGGEVEEVVGMVV